jgi:endonuclease/exonuclease/phosphatase family metal-dependent hydrolase
MRQIAGNAVSNRTRLRRTNMAGWRNLLLAALGALASTAAAAQSAGPAPAFDGALSVMTYNVKGAPWPVTHGRGHDLRAIGDRLRQLRTEGRNPHIVLLQEAFSADARAIARRAGYRFVVRGPGAGERTPEPASAPDAAFLASRSFFHGERSGKLFDSGLLLLSDFPVTGVHRLSYPDFACAGLDCMANKGALLATVEIPGAPAPVDIVTTHLNSRHHARVADSRSLYAYSRQVALLAQFIAANRDPSHPLIVAGDFNVGRAPARGSALEASLPAWGANVPVAEALAVVGRGGQAPLTADAEAVVRRNTDFEFFVPGQLAALTPRAIDVPFGREATGGMLSDHLGYTITFGLAPRPLDIAALDPPASAPAATAPAR